MPKPSDEIVEIAMLIDELYKLKAERDEAVGLLRRGMREVEPTRVGHPQGDWKLDCLIFLANAKLGGKDG